MSKEMAVIGLGVLVILARTSLGLPGSWQTVLLVIVGVALVIIGFLLRGEAIKQSSSKPTGSQGRAYSFVENSPTPPMHDTQERITSLN